MLAVVACHLAWALSDLNDSRTGRWTFWAIYLLTNAWLAVVTHRMVLMEHPGSPLQFDKPALRRLGLFMLALTALWALYAAIKLGFMIVVLNAFTARYVPAGAPTAPAPIELPVSFEVLESVASWLPFLIVGRLSLLLPMIATGQRCQPALAWRYSVGNSWRLAVVVGVLPWLIDYLMDFLYRDGATSFEIVWLAALSALLTVVEVVALSLSYRVLADEFTSPAPPPTDPPA